MRSRERRPVVALLVLGALCLSGCGTQDSGGFADEPVYVDGLNVSDDDLPAVVATSTPSYQTPTDAPTNEPPELDRSELDANLAKLSIEDRALVDHYLHEAKLGEGTWVVAAPMTVDEAKARLLGPNPRLATADDENAMMNARISAYSFLQVGDGVVAWEDTGFADPPRRLLAALSAGGAVSAVATENIEAMTRFGYARDGKIVFDAFEYAFVPDLDKIPAEVRNLAALAWDDLQGPMVETADWFSVALAMSEKVTGVRATRAVHDVEEWYVVPLPWAAMEDE